MKGLRLIAFTEKGYALAQQMAQALHGSAARCGVDCSLGDWTAEAFATADGLIFVGAAGIAVRAIAPFVRSKTADPAVVVVDERARFAIPILSGHLGGANDLARRIGTLTGAMPVLTTATDVNGVFAVDEWARRQGCRIVHPQRIKDVSAKLLAGERVFLQTDWPIAGTPPRGVAIAEAGEADAALTVRSGGQDGLYIVPPIAVVGIGCRKDTPLEAIEEAYTWMLREKGIWEQAVCKVCSIDLKRGEPGLLAFCAARKLPFETFSARQLCAVKGMFTPSAFVRSVTGVDNVCERSAVLGSGGALLISKMIRNGVTMAMALKPFAPDWRWQDG